MSVLILLAVIACVGSFLAVPLFEFVFASLLITPLFKFLVSDLIRRLGVSIPSGGIEQLLYLGCFAVLVLGAYATFGTRKKRLTRWDFYPFLAFTAVFGIAYTLCGFWFDFYDLGERLRDYALLASAIDSPVLPKEPWMEGATLNYYVYWYRFGAMLSSLLNLEVWDTYHTLISFSMAFYGAVVFQIIRVIIGGSVFLSSLGAILIPFGPNFAGMMVWSAKKGGGFETDPGWWGPSRVIQGAIDEFPAWSFLLGDAHPHYLNLAAFPFLLLMLFRVVTAPVSVVRCFTQAALLVIAGALFLMGSNAWEVPMWVGAVGIIAATGVILLKPPLQFAKVSVSSEGESETQSNGFESLKLVFVLGVPLVAAMLIVLRWSSLSLGGKLVLGASALIFAFVFYPRSSSLIEMFKHIGSRLRSLNAKWQPNDPIWCAFWLMLLVALRISSSHIRPENGVLKFVRSPIAVTTTPELFAHWGVQLALITVASLLLYRLSLSTGLMVVFLGCTLLYDKAALFIYVLIGVQLVRMIRAREEANSWRDVFGEGLVISCLGLILLPEIVFLDDSYGGDIERMNTIFKVYTTAWFLAGLAAIYVIDLFIRLRSREINLKAPGATQLVSAILVVGLAFGTFRFYQNGISKRRTTPSNFGSEGLGAADRYHPGSAEIIRVLRKQPYGRVLETQGKPYSFTCFVSTLSGQPAYLGWANHVNLLTRLGEEVGRRERVTDEFYQKTDCVARRDLAIRESVNYIVVGTLEKRKYTNLSTLDFSCFTTLAEQGDYKLYRAP